MSFPIFRKGISYLRTIAFLWSYRSFDSHQKSGDKVLLLDLRENYFTRYLYLFVEFFFLEGYVIYLPFRLKLLHGIKQDHYASLLFRNKIIKLGRPPKNCQYIFLDDQLLSPDYFIKTPPSPGDRFFFVPMAQHPIMYHAGFWNKTVPEVPRKKSFFMAGNFDPETYKELEMDRVFNVMSRNAVFSFLEQQAMLFPIREKEDLLRFFASEDDGKIILINRLTYNIPMEDLREMLSRFDFFFAVPGVVMPLAHNIVEAMSVAAIPFLQKEYAELFQPELTDGVTAIVFNDVHDLLQKLKGAMQLSEQTIIAMRKNVIAYYNAHLIPASLVKKIEANHFTKIYLQGEHYSVALLKERELILK